MRKGDVIVRNVVKEVNFALVEQQAGCNGVYRRIAPTLVEEAAILVQRLKVVNVSRATQPLEIANFKVGPL